MLECLKTSENTVTETQPYGYVFFRVEELVLELWLEYGSFASRHNGFSLSFVPGTTYLHLQSLSLSLVTAVFRQKTNV